MTEGQFQYEDCLLKHHVRTKGWLPSCKSRQKELKSNCPPERKNKRLRYFTFCAVGALDVLMLEIEDVLKRSSGGRLDNVFFFDRDDALIAETKKRIVGAIGFPGDFVKIVSLTDPNEHAASDDALNHAETDLDKLFTREEKRRLAVRREFVKSFPFDIINLDLETFFFKPNDPYPGTLINALRKVFEWQTRELCVDGKSQGRLDSFSLMFTTQVGPPNITHEYRKLLTDYLADNIKKNAALVPLLEGIAGHSDLAKLEKEQFSLFFKLAVPKVIASILLEQDWYVDGEKGIQVFEFERQSKDGPYRILHMVFDVRRQSPRKEERAPIEVPQTALDSYNGAVQKLFTVPAEVVHPDVIDKAFLKEHLDKVKTHRDQLYPAK